MNKTAQAVLFLFFVFVDSVVAKEGQIIFNVGDREYHLNVEIASNAHDRRVGLMYRTSLGDEAGMLFDFVASKPLSMWMKNTFIPLDMVFIRGDHVISRIEEYTIPFSLNPVYSGGSVRYVLEVKGGTARRTGLRPGQELSFSWESSP